MTSIYAWPEDDRPDLGFSDFVAQERRRRGAADPTVKRTAGEQIASVLETAGLATPGSFKPGGTAKLTPLARRIAFGAPLLVGVGTVLDQMNQEGTPLQKLVGTGSALAGNAAGAAVGGFLGGLGGPLAPVTVPLGIAAGSWLGGEMASGAGRALVDAFGPTELDKQIAAYTRTAQAQADAEKYRMETLLPIQKQVADAVLANQLKGAAAMAPIDAQRMRNQALYQGLINGQQQSAQLANTMLTNVAGGYLS